MSLVFISVGATNGRTYNNPYFTKIDLHEYCDVFIDKPVTLMYNG